MNKGLWLRFDIPYSEDANRMRAVLAIKKSNEGTLSLVAAENCRDIHTAIKEIYEKAEMAQISLDNKFCFIFPHDARHGLAWAVKEEAGKKQADFARHIPNILDFPHDLEIGYENFNTGSSEDHLDEDEAQQTILDLNAQALEIFTDGEMVEAMNPLRHALWMVLRYFGWCCPGTMYTIRNLGYTLNMTGTDDNRDEFLYLLERLLYHWRHDPPTAEMWKGAEAVIESTAEMCSSMRADNLARSLMEITAPQRSVV